MRVLILANDCNPCWPSTPLIGYSLACAISNFADVLVVTQIRNKPNIDRAGIGNGRVVYLDTERIAAPLWKLGVRLRGGGDINWGTDILINYPAYLFFEWCAWKHLRRDLQRGEFQVVHRLTPVSTRQAGPVAKNCPVPFLLGPINESLPWPAMHHNILSQNERQAGRFWNIPKLLPWYRSTLKHSAAILTAFDHTLADLPEFAQRKAISFPDIGISPNTFTFKKREKNPQVEILFAGRLILTKLPEVVVRAFAASETLRRHKLVIVGEGPERRKLEALISNNHLSHCVTLTGHIDQAQLARLMRRAEIFAFPSICETGGNVVVEAMACGMVCVVVDYGGPAVLIGEERGVKIPLGDINHLVDRFRKELEDLVADRDCHADLGMAARRHALKYYTWEAKASKMMEIYKWVGSGRRAKPTYWDQAND